MKRLMLAALAAGVWTVACSSTTTVTGGTSGASGTSGTSGTTTSADAGGTSPGDDAGQAAADAAAGPFKLTSSTMTEGGTFPKESTCNASPKQVSPPFTWTPGPAGTKSYALALVDLSNGLTHAAIYDIPATVLELPKGVETKYQPAVPAGAKQTKAYDGVTFGYLGPCPPSGEHNYQFTLYALDVDTLPNMTQSTDAKTCAAEAKKHALGMSTISSKYKQ